MVWQAEQTLYGDAIDVSVDTAGVDARFANHFYDRDIELVYAVMRWYDPRLGLFVNADPAILDGNPNPRDYARNPLREIHSVRARHDHEHTDVAPKYSESYKAADGGMYDWTSEGCAPRSESQHGAIHAASWFVESHSRKRSGLPHHSRGRYRPGKRVTSRSKNCRTPFARR